MKIIKDNSQAFEQLINRKIHFSRRSTEEKVRQIIEDIRANGDAVDGICERYREI